MSLNDDYADRLDQLQTPLWKRLLDVQAPYRWNLRRLKPGRMLDVGCGIGRNLAHAGGVGVDPNAACVRTARARGFEVYTPDEFHAPKASFDTLLIAHVLEHMEADAGARLLADYLPYVRPGGQVILITPQERGYASDPTHVRFLDLAALEDMARKAGLQVSRSYSFPFPRWMGRVFTYNEFVLAAVRS